MKALAPIGFEAAGIPIATRVPLSCLGPVTLLEIIMGSGRAGAAGFIPSDHESESAGVRALGDPTGAASGRRRGSTAKRIPIRRVKLTHWSSKT